MYLITCDSDKLFSTDHQKKLLAHNNGSKFVELDILIFFKNLMSLLGFRLIFESIVSIDLAIWKVLNYA